MCLFLYLVNLNRPRAHPFSDFETVPFLAFLYIIPNHCFTCNYLSNINSILIRLKMLFSCSLGRWRDALAHSIFVLTSV